MLASAWVLGFHGCDRAVGERVLAGQEPVSVSENSHDWLGAGAYFWESDPVRALRWAENVRAHPQHFGQRIRDPFVIGAIIDLGDCLDLGNAACLDELKDSEKQMRRLLAVTGVSAPVNEPGFTGDLDLVKRCLDCAVINFVHSSREARGLPAFDTIRGAFPEGRPLYQGARIMERTHVQICVRDPRRSIQGYFRPLHND